MKGKGVPDAPKLSDCRYYLFDAPVEVNVFQILDDVGHKLLELLAENSRLSNAELGRIVNLSRAAVRDRIQNMVECGIIEQFTISVNPLKVGKEISVFFDIDVEPEKLVETAGILASRHEVTNIYQMTGPSSLHCHGLLPDSTYLEAFTQKILYALPGVKNVQTHVLLRRFKSRTGIRI